MGVKAPPVRVRQASARAGDGPGAGTSLAPETLARGRAKSVDRSVDAADRSVCATSQWVAIDGFPSSNRSGAYSFAAEHPISVIWTDRYAASYRWQLPSH